MGKRKRKRKNFFNLQQRLDVSEAQVKLDVDRGFRTIIYPSEDDYSLSLSDWHLPSKLLLTYKNEKITQLLSWQRECLLYGKDEKENVLNGKYNLIFSAPTSAGKTLVAELLIIKRLFENHLNLKKKKKKKKKVLFILPYVAVAIEKTEYFRRLLKHFQSINVVGLIGNYENNDSANEWDLAIATIEKANSMINRYLKKEEYDSVHDIFTAICVDEFHMIEMSDRGELIDLILTKFNYHQNYDIDDRCQIICMSATMSNIEQYSLWIDNCLSFQSNYRSLEIEEYLMVENRLIDIHQKKTNHLLINIKDYLQYLFSVMGETRKLPRFNDNGNISSLLLKVFLDVTRQLFECLEEEFKLGNGERTIDDILKKKIKEGAAGGILLFVNSRKRAEVLAKSINDDIFNCLISLSQFSRFVYEKFGEIKNKSIEQFFEMIENVKKSFVDNRKLIEIQLIFLLLLYVFDKEKCDDLCQLYQETVPDTGESSRKLLKLISFGIAYHHADLTSEQRNLVEYGFRSQAIKVIVATTTLSAGINLPSSHVIIRNFQVIRSFQSNRIDHILYEQMIGRVGRMGYANKLATSILICEKEMEYENMIKERNEIITKRIEGGKEKSITTLTPQMERLLIRRKDISIDRKNGMRLNESSIAITNDDKEKLMEKFVMDNRFICKSINRTILIDLNEKIVKQLSRYFIELIIQNKKKLSIDNLWKSIDRTYRLRLLFNSHGIDENDRFVFRILSISLTLNYLYKNDLIIIENEMECAQLIDYRLWTNDGIEISFKFKNLFELIINYHSSIFCRSTRFASAVHYSALSTFQAQLIMKDLSKARESVVLDTDLHLLYLITPIDLGRSILDDWNNYLKIFQSLPSAEKRVAQRIGIKERLMVEMSLSNVNRSDNSLHNYERFFCSLILFDLINEKSYQLISEKFEKSCAFIQSIQNRSASYASIVYRFTGALGWNYLETILKQLIPRLEFGIHTDLIDLMSLDLFINRTIARILFDEGLESVECLRDLIEEDVEESREKLTRIILNNYKFNLNNKNNNKHLLNMLSIFIPTTSSLISVEECVDRIIQHFHMFDDGKMEEDEIEEMKIGNDIEKNRSLINVEKDDDCENGVSPMKRKVTENQTIGNQTNQMSTIHQMMKEDNSILLLSDNDDNNDNNNNESSLIIDDFHPKLSLVHSSTFCEEKIHSTNHKNSQFLTNILNNNNNSNNNNDNGKETNNLLFLTNDLSVIEDSELIIDESKNEIVKKEIILTNHNDNKNNDIINNDIINNDGIIDDNDLSVVEDSELIIDESRNEIVKKENIISSNHNDNKFDDNIDSIIDDDNDDEKKYDKNYYKNDDDDDEVIEDSIIGRKEILFELKLNDVKTWKFIELTENNLEETKKFIQHFTTSKKYPMIIEIDEKELHFSLIPFKQIWYISLRSLKMLKTFDKMRHFLHYFFFHKFPVYRIVHNYRRYFHSLLKWWSDFLVDDMKLIDLIHRDKNEYVDIYFLLWLLKKSEEIHETDSSDSQLSVEIELFNYLQQQYGPVKNCEDVDEKRKKKFMFILQIHETFHFLLHRIDESNLRYLFFIIEMKCQKYILLMELVGLYMNGKKLLEFSNNFNDEQTELIKRFRLQLSLTEDDIDVNLESNSSIYTMIRNWECQTIRRQKKRRIVRRQMMKDLSLLYPELFEIIRNYRKNLFLFHQLIQPVFNQIRFMETNDNNDFLFLHYRYNTYNVTGRINAVYPSIQMMTTNDHRFPMRQLFSSNKSLLDDESLEELLKKINISPTKRIKENHFLNELNENRLLISFDYSSIELRVVAFFSQDLVLINLLNEEKIDIFQFVSDEMERLSDIKLTRNSVKIFIYSYIYGASVITIQSNLSKKNNKNFSIDFIKRLISLFQSMFPQFNSFQNHLMEFIESSHSIRTLGGRSRIFSQSASAGSILNTIIQGSVSDIIKYSMGKIMEELEGNHLHSIFPIIQIHDELLFNIREDKLNEFIPIIRDILSESPKEIFAHTKHLTDLQSLFHDVFPSEFNVRLFVKTKCGKNWGQLSHLSI
ncbi:hypothetical protein SNEBB_002152 [Seison nebaliae]|nr:hypothetical protein SNEBB_002152 [Seison nebaliae]